MIDSLGSGMTNSGLISIILPKPLQLGQAPTGELNEKAEGVGFANLQPSTGIEILHTVKIHAYLLGLELLQFRDHVLSANAIDSITPSFILKFRSSSVDNNKYFLFTPIFFGKFF